MDVVSHWFWGVLVTRKHVNWKVAGPMAVLPDLLAFVPSLIYSLANGIERPTVDDTTVTSDFPAIAWEMYQYTHSAVVVTLAVLLTWCLAVLLSCRLAVLLVCCPSGLRNDILDAIPGE